MTISVEYDDDEKELRIGGLDPEGNDLVLSLDEGMELHDALSDALPDVDDIEDEEDLDEDEDDGLDEDDEDDLED